MERIKSKGEDFCLNVFENVKIFQQAILNSLIYLYDPNFKGVLESVERELDHTLCEKMMHGQVYFILLVFSRIKNFEKDKELRFKI